MIRSLSKKMWLAARQMLAFVFRNYHLTRRYYAWVVVFCLRRSYGVWPPRAPWGRW